VSIILIINYNTLTYKDIILIVHYRYLNNNKLTSIPTVIGSLPELRFL